MFLSVYAGWVYGPLFVFFLAVYAICMLFIFIYSIAQLHLLISYISARSKHSSASNGDKFEPCITVQLPVYNELFVVERLIDKICSMDYPDEKLEIQVLDDSTDQSIDMIAAKVQEWQLKGKNIHHIRRSDRSGYKAGALKYGLESAKGEFIAIFDADFLPEKNFLKVCIQPLSDPKIGVVQSRWVHLNREESVITKVQAFALDMHFSVEQTGRNKLGAFMNFNGTAGIWRKSCILDAGNWQDDTLTEDLDLSYRAQLRNWKFVYLEALGSPAELPSIMSAVKSQQYRWNKGGAEVARKNIRSIINSSFPLSIKLHGIFHLLNSSIFAVILIGGIVSVPAIMGIIYFSQEALFLNYGLLLLFTTVVIFSNFLVAHRQLAGKSIWEFLVYFPVFLCLSMGMALHNGIAVIQGLSGKRTAFIRTPKSGKSSWSMNTYIGSHKTSVPALEWALAIYFISGIALGVYMEFYGLIPFHVIQALGYASIWYFSWKDSRKIKSISPKVAFNNLPPV